MDGLTGNIAYYRGQVMKNQNIKKSICAFFAIILLVLWLCTSLCVDKWTFEILFSSPLSSPGYLNNRFNHKKDQAAVFFPRIYLNAKC